MEKEIHVEQVQAFKTRSGNTRFGTSEPKRAVPADQLFEKLKPFQERVAEDIRDGDDEDS